MVEPKIDSKWSSGWKLEWTLESGNYRPTFHSIKICEKSQTMCVCVSVRGVARIRDVGCAHLGFAPYLARICCPKVRCVHPSKWPFWLRKWWERLNSNLESGFHRPLWQEHPNSVGEPKLVRSLEEKWERNGKEIHDGYGQSYGNGKGTGNLPMNFFFGNR